MYALFLFFLNKSFSFPKAITMSKEIIVRLLSCLFFFSTVEGQENEAKKKKK